MTTVRLAVPADAQRIADIYVDTWRSMYAGVLPDRVLTRMSRDRQARAWATELSGRDRRRVLAAEDADEGIVGFIGVGPSRVGPAPFDGEVYTLYVTDDFQGHGIGSDLLRAGFRALADCGFESAVVWVLTANPSRFFYEAMGGRRVAERDEAMWGTVLNQTAYGWPNLTPSDHRPADGR